MIQPPSNLRDDEVWIMEPHGRGYRFRKGKRHEIATSDLAAVGVLIAGLIACSYWFNLWS